MTPTARDGPLPAPGASVAPAAALASAVRPPGPPRAAPAAPGGITDTDFALLARIVQQESGIFLPPAKKGLVASRLTRRLRALALPDIAAYCRHLQSPAGAGERGQLVSALTTNVTRFFREDHHFDALRTEVLPPLLKAAASGRRRVRLWSAGCSSGQEAYSLAMTVLDLMPEAARHDIRILATDIDPQVLETARAGVYRDEDLAPLGAERRRRWVAPAPGRPGHGRIGDTPRALVVFAPLNLIGDWPMRGRFDVIFCRNVVIYFDAATQTRLWRRFAQILPDGGELFIGHSERISRDVLACFTSAGITRYRRTATPLPASPGTAQETPQ